MSDHILIVDASSLLNSLPIQIIHKHPDFSHRVRSDLDHYEYVAESFPIALANKIIPFLEISPTDPTAVTPPERQQSVSPLKRKRRHGIISPRKASPPKVMAREPSELTHLVPQSTTSTALITPKRQLLPPPSLHPTTIDSSLTSRTTSPGGTALSPLTPGPDEPFTLDTPLRLKPQDPSTIPRALFTPAAASTASAPVPKRRRCTLARTLVSFDPTPHPHLPTLTLRHPVPTAALRDVLAWTLRSVEHARIVPLHPRPIRFRDPGRVRDIREVCLVLGLERMRGVAQALLERFEGEGEWERERVGAGNAAQDDG